MGDAEHHPLVIDRHEPDDLAASIEGLGVPVERRKIQPADYVVGEVAVERKTVWDLHGSLVSKRLFDQLTRLASTYEKPVLLLEGDTAAWERLQNPDGVRGALVAVALDYGIPVLPADSREASAHVLARVWRRTVEGGGAGAPVRHKPRRLSAADEQKFAVQGLPAVGDVLSERMLTRFGSVRRVFAASEAELRRVPLMGATKARRISELLDRPFEGPQRRLV